MALYRFCSRQSRRKFCESTTVDSGFLALANPGAIVEISPSQIGISHFLTGRFSSQRTNLGAIFPIDLDLNGLHEYLSIAAYRTDASFAGEPLGEFNLLVCETETCVELLNPSSANFVDGNSVIPEPASINLMMLGLLIIVRARHKGL